MSDIRDVLKNNLIAYSKDRQITQKELSERLGVTQSAVSHWFKGDNSPNIEVVSKVAEILSVPMSALLSEAEICDAELVSNVAQKNAPSAGGDKQSEKEIAPLYSSEALEVAHGYDKLDAYGQRIVRMVVIEEKIRCEEQAKESSTILHTAAIDGSRHDAELDAGFTPLKKSTQVLPQKYKSETGGTPPAPEEK